MSISYRSAPGPEGARITLSRFVRQKAEEAGLERGYGWIGVPVAPGTYPQLRAADERSRRTGEPLPVSNLYCEDTIYVEPADNVAFRFWHDVSHVRLGLSFSLEDEWELASWHLRQLQLVGLGPGTREYSLLRADLFGQLILLGIARRFPFAQGDFSRTCAQLGMEEGILRELRRVS